jgi:hypothetical protein
MSLAGPSGRHRERPPRAALPGEVIGQEAARVRVSPITGPRGVHAVTSRDVAEHAEGASRLLGWS